MPKKKLTKRTSAQKSEKKTKPEKGQSRNRKSLELREETIDAIAAIVFIIIALLLLLAAFEKAGAVGGFLFTFLSKLFGVGYYLLPTILIALGISFLASLKQNFATAKYVGSGIFLLAGLATLDMAAGSGGLIGSLISKPLVSLFDVYVSYIITIGLIVISLLVIFDIPLKFTSVRNWLDKNKKETQEEDITINSPIIEEGQEKKILPDSQKQPQEESAAINETQEVEVTEEDLEKQNKKGNGLIFFSRKNRSTGTFTPPPLSLLQKDSGRPGVGDIKANANIIRRTLHNFGIDVEMDEISIGPSVTRYALKPAEGVKLSRIEALQKDLALALAAHPLRIEAPIPGKSLVGIEIPNSSRTTVGLGSIFQDPEFKSSPKPLLMALGRSISGKTFFADLAKMPHLLIAGTTGSGKSVTMNTFIVSLLYRNPPENLKFIMVDPKRVELTLYNKIPHLLTPVITDAKKTILALKWAAKEMDRRYDVLEEHSVRDIKSYHENILKPSQNKEVNEESDNKKELDPMPYIVIAIDELADLMQAYPRELESSIVRLAQMSRAVGIHLILSTQRPSVNIITGLIKANVPARAALQVSSQIDSRTILDMPGAEKLLGAGDMLYLSSDSSQPTRIQNAFVSEDEVKAVVKNLIKSHQDDLPGPEIDFSGNATEIDPAFDASSGSSSNGFDGDDNEDELYEEARSIVISAGKASTSYIQRKLRVGYARAARLIDILEERGVVGPADGSKPREVLQQDSNNNAADQEEDLDEETEEQLDQE